MYIAKATLQLLRWQIRPIGFLFSFDVVPLQLNINSCNRHINNIRLWRMEIWEKNFTTGRIGKLAPTPWATQNTAYLDDHTFLDLEHLM